MMKKIKLNKNRLVKTPIHPGEYLRDELIARKITQNYLASHIGVSPAYVSDIINGRRGISALTAVKISKALGGDPQTWLNLQSNFDLDSLDIDSINIEVIAA